MPIPTPNEGEELKDFRQRCMGNDTMVKEYPDEKQRYAICNQQWRDKNKAVSLEQQQRRIQEAWATQYPGGDAVVPIAESRGYVVETFDSYVIVGIDGAYWKVSYKDDDGAMTFASRDKWRKVEQQTRWANAKNALKAVSRTDDELRVANYIVLFGGRDLEGIASDSKNQDGSLGEFFTAETDLESAYTKAGMLYVDWEHGFGKELDGDDAPGGDDVLGVVDWSTAKADTRGVWVERALMRRSEYVKFLEELIDSGLIGTSSMAVQDGIRKGQDGQITRWPLKRDTLTFQPMEPRMIREYGNNHIQAFKALGIPVPDDTANDPLPPEAEPEADTSAASAAGQGRMRMQLLKNTLTMEA